MNRHIHTATTKNARRAKREQVKGAAETKPHTTGALRWPLMVAGSAGFGVLGFFPHSAELPVATTVFCAQCEEAKKRQQEGTRADAALERAALYVDAGADMIFVEAPRSEEEIRSPAARARGRSLKESGSHE